MKLEPYNQNATCAKCGCDEIKTRHEDVIDNDPCWYDRKYKPYGKWPEHEYMHRSCANCGYEWPEQVLS